MHCSGFLAPLHLPLNHTSPPSLSPPSLPHTETSEKARTYTNALQSWKKKRGFSFTVKPLLSLHLSRCRLTILIQPSLISALFFLNYIPRYCSIPSFLCLLLLPPPSSGKKPWWQAVLSTSLWSKPPWHPNLPSKSTCLVLLYCFSSFHLPAVLTRHTRRLGATPAALFDDYKFMCAVPKMTQSGQWEVFVRGGGVYVWLLMICWLHTHWVRKNRSGTDGEREKDTGNKWEDWLKGKQRTVESCSGEMLWCSCVTSKLALQNGRNKVTDNHFI